MTKAELQERWVSLVLSSPLVTKPCDKGCRSTFSDCNANTTFVIEDADTKEVFDLRDKTLDAALPATRTEVA
jgi:hypothetical protein